MIVNLPGIITNFKGEKNKNWLNWACSWKLAIQTTAICFKLSLGLKLVWRLHHPNSRVITPRCLDVHHFIALHLQRISIPIWIVVAFSLVPLFFECQQPEQGRVHCSRFFAIRPLTEEKGGTARTIHHLHWFSKPTYGGAFNFVACRRITRLFCYSKVVTCSSTFELEWPQQKSPLLFCLLAIVLTLPYLYQGVGVTKTSIRIFDYFCLYWPHVFTIFPSSQWILGIRSKENNRTCPTIFLSFVVPVERSLVIKWLTGKMDRTLCSSELRVSSLEISCWMGGFLQLETTFFNDSLMTCHSPFDSQWPTSISIRRSFLLPVWLKPSFP